LELKFVIEVQEEGMGWRKNSSCKNKSKVTSTKRIFVVGPKRHFSSGIEPTLTQETLIMTSVNKTDVVLNTTMSVRTTRPTYDCHGCQHHIQFSLV